MRAARRILVLSMALTLAAACGGKKKEPPAASDFHKPVLETLRKSGLTVGEFETTAAKPYQARACVRGEVSKLDVMACQYDSEQSAERAKPSLEQFVSGAGTGAVRRQGTLALAIADRAKVDVRGKLMNKLLKSLAEKASN